MSGLLQTLDDNHPDSSLPAASIDALLAQAHGNSARPVPRSLYLGRASPVSQLFSERPVPLAAAPAACALLSAAQKSREQGDDVKRLRSAVAAGGAVLAAASRQREQGALPSFGGTKAEQLAARHVTSSSNVAWHLWSEFQATRNGSSRGVSETRNLFVAEAVTAPLEKDIGRVAKQKKPSAFSSAASHNNQEQHLQQQQQRREPDALSICCVTVSVGDEAPVDGRRAFARHAYLTSDTAVQQHLREEGNDDDAAAAAILATSAAAAESRKNVFRPAPEKKQKDQLQQQQQPQSAPDVGVSPGSIRGESISSNQAANADPLISSTTATACVSALSNCKRYCAYARTGIDVHTVHERRQPLGDQGWGAPSLLDDGGSSSSSDSSSCSDDGDENHYGASTRSRSLLVVTNSDSTCHFRWTATPGARAVLPAPFGAASTNFSASFNTSFLNSGSGGASFFRGSSAGAGGEQCDSEKLNAVLLTLCSTTGMSGSENKRETLDDTDTNFGALLAPLRVAAESVPVQRLRLQLQHAVVAECNTAIEIINVRNRQKQKQTQGALQKSPLRPVTAADVCVTAIEFVQPVSAEFSMQNELLCSTWSVNVQFAFCAADELAQEEDSLAEEVKKTSAASKGSVAELAAAKAAAALAEQTKQQKEQQNMEQLGEDSEEEKLKQQQQQALLMKKKRNPQLRAAELKRRRVFNMNRRATVVCLWDLIGSASHAPTNNSNNNNNNNDGMNQAAAATTQRYDCLSTDIVCFCDNMRAAEFLRVWRTKTMRAPAAIKAGLTRKTAAASSTSATTAATVTATTTTAHRASWAFDIETIPGEMIDAQLIKVPEWSLVAPKKPPLSLASSSSSVSTFALFCPVQFNAWDSTLLTTTTFDSVDVWALLSGDGPVAPLSPSSASFATRPTLLSAAPIQLVRLTSISTADLPPPFEAATAAAESRGVYGGGRAAAQEFIRQRRCERKGVGASLKPSRPVRFFSASTWYDEDALALVTQDGIIVSTWLQIDDTREGAQTEQQQQQAPRQSRRQVEKSNPSPSAGSSSFDAAFFAEDSDDDDDDDDDDASSQTIPIESFVVRAPRCCAELKLCCALSNVSSSEQKESSANSSPLLRQWICIAVVSSAADAADLRRRDGGGGGDSGSGFFLVALRSDGIIVKLRRRIVVVRSGVAESAQLLSARDNNDDISRKGHAPAPLSIAANPFEVQDSFTVDSVCAPVFAAASTAALCPSGGAGPSFWRPATGLTGESALVFCAATRPPSSVLAGSPWSRCVLCATTANGVRVFASFDESLSSSSSSSSLSSRSDEHGTLLDEYGTLKSHPEADALAAKFPSVTVAALKWHELRCNPRFSVAQLLEDETARQLNGIDEAMRQRLIAKTVRAAHSSQHPSTVVRRDFALCAGCSVLPALLHDCTEETTSTLTTSGATSGAALSVSGSKRRNNMHLVALRVSSRDKTGDGDIVFMMVRATSPFPVAQLASSSFAPMPCSRQASVLSMVSSSSSSYHSQADSSAAVALVASSTLRGLDRSTVSQVGVLAASTKADDRVVCFVLHPTGRSVIVAHTTRIRLFSATVGSGLSSALERHELIQQQQQQHRRQAAATASPIDDDSDNDAAAADATGNHQQGFRAPTFLHFDGGLQFARGGISVRIPEVHRLELDDTASVLLAAQGRRIFVMDPTTLHVNFIFDGHLAAVQCMRFVYNETSRDGVVVDKLRRRAEQQQQQQQQLQDAAAAASSTRHSEMETSCVPTGVVSGDLLGNAHMWLLHPASSTADATADSEAAAVEKRKRQQPQQQKNGSSRPDADDQQQHREQQQSLDSVENDDDDVDLSVCPIVNLPLYTLHVSNFLIMDCLFIAASSSPTTTTTTTYQQQHQQQYQQPSLSASVHCHARDQAGPWIMCCGRYKETLKDEGTERDSFSIVLSSVTDISKIQQQHKQLERSASIRDTSILRKRGSKRRQNQVKRAQGERTGFVAVSGIKFLDEPEDIAQEAGAGSDGEDDENSDVDDVVDGGAGGNEHAGASGGRRNKSNKQKEKKSDAFSTHRMTVIHTGVFCHSDNDRGFHWDQKSEAPDGGGEAMSAAAVLSNKLTSRRCAGKLLELVSLFKQGGGHAASSSAAAVATATHALVLGRPDGKVAVYAWPLRFNGTKPYQVLPIFSPSNNSASTMRDLFCPFPPASTTTAAASSSVLDPFYEHLDPNGHEVTSISFIRETGTLSVLSRQGALSLLRVQHVEWSDAQGCLVDLDCRSRAVFVPAPARGVGDDDVFRDDFSTFTLPRGLRSQPADNEHDDEQQQQHEKQQPREQQEQVIAQVPTATSWFVDVANHSVPVPRDYLFHLDSIHDKVTAEVRRVEAAAAARVSAASAQYQRWRGKMKADVKRRMDELELNISKELASLRTTEQRHAATLERLEKEHQNRVDGVVLMQHQAEQWHARKLAEGGERLAAIKTELHCRVQTEAREIKQHTRQAEAEAEQRMQRAELERARAEAALTETLRRWDAILDQTATDFELQRQAHEEQHRERLAQMHQARAKHAYAEHVHRAAQKDAAAEIGKLRREIGRHEEMEQSAVAELQRTTSEQRVLSAALGEMQRDALSEDAQVRALQETQNRLDIGRQGMNANYDRLFDSIAQRDATSAGTQQHATTLQELVSASTAEAIVQHRLLQLTGKHAAVVAEKIAATQAAHAALAAVGESTVSQLTALLQQRPMLRDPALLIEPLKLLIADVIEKRRRVYDGLEESIGIRELLATRLGGNGELSSQAAVLSEGDQLAKQQLEKLEQERTKILLVAGVKRAAASQASASATATTKDDGGGKLGDVLPDEQQWQQQMLQQSRAQQAAAMEEAARRAAARAVRLAEAEAQREENALKLRQELGTQMRSIGAQTAHERKMVAALGRRKMEQFSDKVIDSKPLMTEVQLSRAEVRRDTSHADHLQYSINAAALREQYRIKLESDDVRMLRGAKVSSSPPEAERASSPSAGHNHHHHFPNQLVPMDHVPSPSSLLAVPAGAGDVSKPGSLVNKMAGSIAHGNVDLSRHQIQKQHPDRHLLQTTSLQRRHDNDDDDDDDDGQQPKNYVELKSAVGDLATSRLATSPTHLVATPHRLLVRRWRPPKVDRSSRFLQLQHLQQQQQQQHLSPQNITTSTGASSPPAYQSSLHGGIKLARNVETAEHFSPTAFFVSALSPLPRQSPAQQQPQSTERAPVNRMFQIGGNNKQPQPSQSEFEALKIAQHSIELVRQSRVRASLQHRVLFDRSVIALAPAVSHGAAEQEQQQQKQKDLINTNSESAEEGAGGGKPRQRSSSVSRVNFAASEDIDWTGTPKSQSRASSASGAARI